MRSEAAFASLCGVCPIEASSGRIVRHRLNRGGNRQANSALYRIAFTRMRYDKKTIAYVEKRRSEGKSTKEIIRCLKRYIAREIYPVLLSPKREHKPIGAELKALRRSLGLTQEMVGNALGCLSVRVSEIEREARRLPELESRYHQWLNLMKSSHECA